MNEPRFKMYFLERDLYAPYQSTTHDIFIIDLDIYDTYDQKLQLFMEKANDGDDAYDVFWIERCIKKENPRPLRFADEISLAKILHEVEILYKIYHDTYYIYELNENTIGGDDYVNDYLAHVWNDTASLFNDSEMEHDLDLESGISPLWTTNTEQMMQRDTKKMICTVYEQVQQMKIELFSAFVATRRIQRVWREVIANPSFLVCRKRLFFEFGELVSELGRGSSMQKGDDGLSDEDELDRSEKQKNERNRKERKRKRTIY